jgi:hypothetical protein
VFEWHNLITMIAKKSFGSFEWRWKHSPSFATRKNARNTGSIVPYNKKASNNNEDGHGDCERETNRVVYKWNRSTVNVRCNTDQE